MGLKAREGLYVFLLTIHQETAPMIDFASYRITSVTCSLLLLLLLEKVRTCKFCWGEVRLIWVGRWFGFPRALHAVIRSSVLKVRPSTPEDNRPLLRRQMATPSTSQCSWLFSTDIIIISSLFLRFHRMLRKIWYDKWFALAKLITRKLPVYFSTFIEKN